MENPFRITTEYVYTNGEVTTILTALMVGLNPVLYSKPIVPGNPENSLALLKKVKEIINISYLFEKSPFIPFIVMESKGSDSNIIYRIDEHIDPVSGKTQKELLVEFFQLWKEKYGGYILSINAGYDNAHSLKSQMLAGNMILNFRTYEEAMDFIENFEDYTNLLKI